jgi:parvulin-like peptidyl-prolyl isomerase
LRYPKLLKCLISSCFILSFYSLLLTPYSFGFTDRVVAFVDNDAITLSEFQQQRRDTAKLLSGVTDEEVINTMINRKLILREAKKYRIEAPAEEDIMKDFIDLKVRAFIKVGEQDIEDFYRQNIDKFEGKTFDIVRDEIEKYLTEKELNEMLKKVISDLRKSVYVKIQLVPQ